MIDAATFANAHNAFWHAYAPTCEHFVRRVNMEGLERFATPMPESATSKRRAVIAEYAFSLFVEKARNVFGDGEVQSNEEIEEVAWSAAETRLVPYAQQGLDLTRDLHDDEIGEVSEISNRLLEFFAAPKQSISLRPVFPGCGFVDASEGDVAFDQTIFEIKTVARKFRSADFLQTITYAALNYSSNQLNIDKVGLVNPRSGQFCEYDIDYVCSEISGRMANDLFSIIVHSISSGEISR